MALATVRVKKEIEESDDRLGPIRSPENRGAGEGGEGISMVGDEDRLGRPTPMVAPMLAVKLEAVECEEVMRESESPRGQVIDVSSDEEGDAGRQLTEDGSETEGRRGVVRPRSVEDEREEEEGGEEEGAVAGGSAEHCNIEAMASGRVSKRAKLDGMWKTAMGTPILRTGGEKEESPIRHALQQTSTGNTRLTRSATKAPDKDKEINRQQEQQVARIDPITCRQFWHAGEYESLPDQGRVASGGMDHVRVHPKFLHSNATSHKWALGAIAELLDNAVDEVVHGATFVLVDKITNPLNGSSMLLIEDDGGGMTPDRLRQCMSLGYSAKSKSANMIGQYGNGFKTSTMRLGADVIVFSRCLDGGDGRLTQSIGMLSYTFLRRTGHEDIIVPMVDFEISADGGEPRPLIRTSEEDWTSNLDTITQWSPFSSLADLLMEAEGMGRQGTRVLVYNLWENDEGDLELDFETDADDIQIRGGNRDEKRIALAKKYPASRTYLTYRHSLRSYASILYLRRPNNFRIILRGKEVRHHNIIDDLMHTQEKTYRPHVSGDNQKENQKEAQFTVVTTIGFVKDAPHVDISGFSVYHKNRLIKPFWRVWSVAGSGGRGVIGVLEANFVEPAHDKQGFERTLVLQRLEQRLNQMQKQYWNLNCMKVGYHPNRKLGTPVVASKPSPQRRTIPISEPTSPRDSARSPVDVKPDIHKSPDRREAAVRSSVTAERLRSLDANVAPTQRANSAVVSPATGQASEWTGRTRRTTPQEKGPACRPTATSPGTAADRRSSGTQSDKSGLEEIGRMVSRNALVQQNGNTAIASTVDIARYNELVEENEVLKERCRGLLQKRRNEEDEKQRKAAELEKMLAEVKKKLEIVTRERDVEKRRLTKQRQDAEKQVQELQQKLKDVLAKLRTLEEDKKSKENRPMS